MQIALLTLLHILIPVYWLGGDLGAFYGSRFLVDPKRSVSERMLALKILNDIDMAPRTALILALPTGLTLAVVKSWLFISPILMLLMWILAFAWLGLAWLLHVRHGGPSESLRKLDLAVRYLIFIGLLLAGGACLIKFIDVPIFIGFKMIALSLCVLMGLIVRRMLKPLGPAIAEMKMDGPSPVV